MRSLRITACAACLLVLAETHAIAQGDLAFNLDESTSVSLGKSAITVDELHDLNTQSAAERRRRVDVVLASHPDELAARFMRVEDDLRLNDGAAMISDTEVLLASPSLQPPLRRFLLYRRAEALTDSRRYEEAIAAANEALETDDSYPEALMARGWARYHQNRMQTDAPLADLDRALQRKPSSGIGHYQRAVVLQARGELDLATQDFECAVQLMPSDLLSHRDYGVLLFMKHDLARALKQFDAAVSLAPRDAAPLAWRASTLVALRRLDDAAVDDRRVDELGAAGEDVAPALSDVGDVLEDMLDFDSAAREYQRSLALKTDPDVEFWLARMQWFTGQFEQPIRYFRERSGSAKPNPYMPIWLFIVRGRANPVDEPGARIELAALAPAHQPPVWTDALVDMLLGRTTLESVLAEADKADTYKLRAGRRCQADYYAAEQLLMRGQKEPAGRLLEEAYWVCPSSYGEAHAVVAARRLLDASLSAH
jgi:tetratricopeptide (TPR) repeat protein